MIAIDSGTNVNGDSDLERKKPRPVESWLSGQKMPWKAVVLITQELGLARRFFKFLKHLKGC
jgi:hypothetical protein